MKKLALPLLMLSGLTQAENISFNEISLEYIKGEQDPVGDVSPKQQVVEGAQFEVKAELGSLFYVVAAYEDTMMDYSKSGFESELKVQDASLGLGIHTPINREIPDTALFLEARANQVSWEYEDNSSVKSDDEETGQTVRLGLMLAPLESLEVRPAISRLSGVDGLNSTAYEVGFLVRPVDSFGFSANFVEKIDLDQRRYEVGVVYKF